MRINCTRTTMVDIVVLYYILLLFTIISVPLYIAILLMLFLLRNKPTFTGSFFTLSISTGLFDLLHLLVVWFLERCLRFNWIGLTSTVLISLSSISKMQTYVWWYTAFGQKIGVLLTALNRLMVIVFNKEWKGKVMHVFLLVHWLFPFILTSPKLFLSFDYVFANNSQNGLVAVQISQSIWQGYYCFCGCFLISILCAFCYFCTFWKARSVRLKMTNGKNTKEESSKKRKQNAELKLAFMGSLMALLTMVCGIYCLIIFSISSDYVTSVLLPIGDILLDVYACIHPYLLLAFSPPIRKHFKTMLRCGNLNQVESEMTGGVAQRAINNRKNIQVKSRL